MDKFAAYLGNSSELEKDTIPTKILSYRGSGNTHVYYEHGYFWISIKSTY